MASIHPTALVDSAAELAADVTIGPFAIVEAGVSLGPGVTVEAHAQLLTGTRIGAGTRIARAAILGDAPQDLGFDPAVATGVSVGKSNIIREHVTIHRATRAGESTTLGDGNYLMVGTHIGHDVVMGDQNILANGVLLAGHIRFGSRTVVGGGAVFHQFLRIGDYCMIQGNGSFSKDIPPFLLAMRINRVAGLNVVGLRRAGFSPDDRAELKALFGLVWRGPGHLGQAIEEAEMRPWQPVARQLLDFLKAPSKKGVCDNREHD